MHAAKLLVATICVSAATLSALQAATYEVQVVDATVNSAVFVPNDVTIAVGDTVRWVNGAGGFPHDVTADDQSWASPEGNEFVYERTFNTVGEIGYHCAYHDPDDADGTHHGIIRVTGVPEPAFTINAGLNDSWYNPDTGGQGFFITVFPDIGMVFLAWFTYEVERPPGDVTAMLGDPGHRWLTAFGPYSGDTATLGIEITTGGVFDSAEPDPTQTPDGTIELEFMDCERGTVHYRVDSLDLEGSVPIQRLADDNVARCEEIQGSE